MDTLKLLDDISVKKLEPFFAPVLDWKGKILSIQHNLPYWWNIKIYFMHGDFRPVGWFQFRPDVQTGTVAIIKIDETLKIFRRKQFLSQLKTMNVIALFPIDEITWLVSPYNLSDAHQRGWKYGKPRKMHLVNQNITSGKNVVAVEFGNELLYSSLGIFPDAGTPRAREHANGIIQARIDEIHKEQQKLERAEKLKTAEGQIGASLEFMGATLKSWSKNLTGYNVRWELNGKSYSMEIDTNMRIDSAGVCLAGTSGWHSLASIVAVMEERG